MRICRRVSCPRVLLWLSNILLMAATVALLIIGGLLYKDQPKLIISMLGVSSDFLAELPKPLFYYAAFLLAVLGLLGLFASILGLWASCWTNYCTLTLYFLVVFILLIGEFVLSISVAVWPNCLGLNLDEDEMVRDLQGKYGIPGHEDYTVAIDLIQTRFQCCGISSDINYDTSHWLLQSYAKKDLTVPLTCCVLNSEEAEDGLKYLDPQPTNLTLCQSVQRSDYAKARHLKSCLEDLQQFFQHHLILFLGMISIVVLVKFFVLLSIIYVCTRMKRRQRESIDHHIAEFERKVNNRRNIMISNAPSSGSPSPIPVDLHHQESYGHATTSSSSPLNNQMSVTSFRPRTGVGGDIRNIKAYLV